MIALKIIGGLILILILLLLAALLCILFVPFHYRISGSYLSGIPDGTVELHWLLHAVTLSVTYHHGSAVSGWIRILGITVRRIEGLPQTETDNDPEGALLWEE